VPAKGYNDGGFRPGLRLSHDIRAAAVSDGQPGLVDCRIFRIGCRQ
jgi:hypothetical protein